MRDTVPTIKIAAPGTERGWKIINLADFRPGVDKPYREFKSRRAAPEADE